MFGAKMHPLCEPRSPSPLPTWKQRRGRGVGGRGQARAGPGRERLLAGGVAPRVCRPQDGSAGVPPASAGVPWGQWPGSSPGARAAWGSRGEGSAGPGVGAGVLGPAEKAPGLGAAARVTPASGPFSDRKENSACEAVGSPPRTALMRTGPVVKGPGLAARLGDADPAGLCLEAPGPDPSLGLAVRLLSVRRPNGFEWGPGQAAGGRDSCGGAGPAGGLAAEAEACNLGAVPPDQGDMRNPTPEGPCTHRRVGCAVLAVRLLAEAGLGVAVPGCSPRPSAPRPAVAHGQHEGVHFLSHPRAGGGIGDGGSCRGTSLSSPECPWGPRSALPLCFRR